MCSLGNVTKPGMAKTGPAGLLATAMICTCVWVLQSDSTCGAILCASSFNDLYYFVFIVLTIADGMAARIWVCVEGRSNSFEASLPSKDAVVDDLIQSVTELKDVCPGNVTASIDGKKLKKSLPVSQITPTPTKEMPVLFTIHNGGMYTYMYMYMCLILQSTVHVEQSCALHHSMISTTFLFFVITLRYPTS